MDYIDIIEKSIYNIDSKICGIIDDYTVLQDSQKVADYAIQFLRTYLEHIAARIYAHEILISKYQLEEKINGILNI